MLSLKSGNTVLLVSCKTVFGLFVFFLYTKHEANTSSLLAED